MRIIIPSKNLGCLGFRLSENIYFDFHKTWETKWWKKYRMFFRVRSISGYAGLFYVNRRW